MEYLFTIDYSYTLESVILYSYIEFVVGKRNWILVAIEKFLLYFFESIILDEREN